MRVDHGAALTRPKLRVDAACKRYGSVVALHPTNIDLRQGEFLTLLGPSGSGKTTLLMIIAGLIEPDGGDVWIDGRLATYAPPFMRDIGVVFQNYALFPHLSVADNVAFPLRMRRRSRIEVREEVARVLELVQLPHLAERMPRQLSGGQQQRVALARCIVYRPSIILMDEPLGALDKKLRDQLQIEIKRLHRQIGTTILYVTHDQQEALTMSDRICLMNHGHIEQIGPPNDLYFRPRSVFAADFLGESNILPARLARQEDGFAILDCPAFGAPIRAAGAPPDSVRPGDALMVMMRPESLFIALKPQPGWNAGPATVTDVIFSGGVTRTIVEPAGAASIVVAGLTVESALSVEPGLRLTLQWPPESTVMLPAQP